jgi:hypothetical protein
LVGNNTENSDIINETNGEAAAISTPGKETSNPVQDGLQSLPPGNASLNR